MLPENKSIEQVKEEFIEALIENNGNLYQTYNTLYPKFNYNDYYKLRKEDPEFDARIKTVKEKQCHFVESKLWEKIVDGDLTAIKYYLSTQGGYRETQKIEMEASVQQNLNISIEEQIKEMKKLLADDNS